MVWRRGDGQAGDLGDRTLLMEGEREWQNVKNRWPNGLKRGPGAHRKWNRLKPMMEMVK